MNTEQKVLAVVTIEAIELQAMFMNYLQTNMKYLPEEVIERWKQGPISIEAVFTANQTVKLSLREPNETR